MEEELKIHPTLQQLLPEPTSEELNWLRVSLTEHGYDPSKPIITWQGYIADGHHRYRMCKELGIPFTTQELEDVETLLDVEEWVMRTQLSQRNIIPAVKVKYTQQYRDIIAEWSKQHQRESGGDRKSEDFQRIKELVKPQIKPVAENAEQKSVPPNLVEPISTDESATRKQDRETATQLAKMAGMSRESYRQAIIVLNSDDEELKEKMLSGELTIYAAYKEHMVKKKKPKKPAEEITDDSLLQTITKTATKIEKELQKLLSYSDQLQDETAKQQAQELITSIRGVLNG